MANRLGALGGLAVEAGGSHIAVADRFYLLHPVLFAQRVETANQLVQKVRDVLRRQGVRRLRKSGEIGEHDAQRLDAVGNALRPSRF